MAWQTPKTDWAGTDYFNLDPDYNRISGDIEYLQDFSERLYPAFSLVPMGEYDYEDFPYPSFLNNIVGNAESLADNTVKPLGWREMRTYAANEPGWNQDDLNIIEGNLGLLYQSLHGQWNLLPMLEFELGGSEF